MSPGVHLLQSLLGALSEPVCLRRRGDGAIIALSPALQDLAARQPGGLSALLARVPDDGRAPSPRDLIEDGDRLLRAIASDIEDPAFGQLQLVKFREILGPGAVAGRGVVENLMEGFAVLAAVRGAGGRIEDFRLDYVNEAGLKLLGARPEERLGRRITEFAAPGTLARLLEAYRRVVETGVPETLASQQLEVRNSRGAERRNLDLRIARSGDGVMVSWRDNTQAALAEAEVRELDLALSHAVEGIARVGADQAVERANPAFAAILGARPEEIEGQRWDRMFPSDSSARVREAHARMSRDGSAELELASVRRDGSRFFGRLILVRREPRPGERAGHFAFLKDITQLRQAESALEVLERRLRQTVSDLPLKIFTTDANGVITFSAGGALRMLGRKSETEMVGRSMFEVHAGDREFCSSLRRALDGESSACALTAGPLHFEGRVHPIEDEAGNVAGASGLLLDVSERRRSERIIGEQQKALVQSAKMTALGQMAAGISHEINNPLAVINGAAYLIRRKLGKAKFDPAELDQLTQRVQETSHRISKIIDGLQLFARDGAGDDSEPFDVGLVVSETLSFCRQRFERHGVRLEVLVPPGPVVVECRSVQVSQVLLNLLNNAFDAVEGLPDAWVRVELRQLAGSIELAVTDSGPGIRLEDRDRVFQPFWTSKGVGKGTGLGLSIAKGIAESHQGTLTLDPASPQTRFALQLPLVQPRPRARRQVAAERVPPPASPT